MYFPIILLSICLILSCHSFGKTRRFLCPRVTMFAVDYICCGPVAEPVGPSDFLPSGLDSPTRCLLCRQTRQQSKSRIFIETVLQKPLWFPKISNHLRQIQEVGLKRWSPWPSSGICFSWTPPTASSSTHQPSSTSTHLGRSRFILVLYIWVPLDANCN